MLGKVFLSGSLASFVCYLLVAGLGSPALAEGPPLAEKRDLSWVFNSPKRPSAPEVKNKTRVINPIDAFILAKLEAKGLSPSERAEKLTLLRRVTFDLTGLPPTLQEQQAFLADTSPEAYAKVVDRLLGSPRYGERWAQHWLDLVRYAESDGFKADDLRPQAYRYRDYVIKAFNDNLPYDRFIRQQLAGDELEPDNPEALIATGFNRLWPDEYNAANLEQRRQEILDDMTEVTGLTFLGLTVGCARCHDHKYDPTLQSDYYRLQAFFAPMLPRDDVVALDPKQKQQHEEKVAAWEAATEKLRQEMDSLVSAKRDEMRKQAMGKFRKEIQETVLVPEEKRTPYQKQIASMAEQQIERAERDAAMKLPEDKKKRFQELEKQMSAMQPKAPAPAPSIMAIGDVGPEAPPVHLLSNGNWQKPREELQPGFPSFLGDAKPDTKTDSKLVSTGRRAALARWLTRNDHPLTARVMVNRLWQHHFGAGIVATASDFGAQGTPPTHPELLDWLAVEFVESGWNLKHMHRLMVTSATYCQSSLIDPKNPQQAQGFKVDKANTLLWHAHRRRLEGEALRDAALSVSGELNPRIYGPSAKPKLPEGISKYAWKPDPKSEDQNRRSVYVLAKRNMRYPMFDAFDLPDQHNSCARRSETTTAPQALLLINGEFTLERGQAWAAKLLTRFSNDERALLAEAYQSAWGRPATEEELSLGQGFLTKQSELLKNRDMKPDSLALPAGWSKTKEPWRAAALVDFCHALLNSNEMLYVD